MAPTLVLSAATMFGLSMRRCCNPLLSLLLAADRLARSNVCALAGQVDGHLWREKNLFYYEDIMTTPDELQDKYAPAFAAFPSQI